MDLVTCRADRVQPGDMIDWHGRTALIEDMLYDERTGDVTLTLDKGDGGRLTDYRFPGPATLAVWQ